MLRYVISVWILFVRTVSEAVRFGEIIDITSGIFVKYADRWFVFDMSFASIVEEFLLKESSAFFVIYHYCSFLRKRKKEFI